MRSFLFYLIMLVPLALQAEPLIEAQDADGVLRGLNPRSQVTVIVYSNPTVQERTREAGRALDLFQGRKNFRSIVVVDLRGTMADWAAGYTVRRMVKDLDKEALRVTPAYRDNGNEANPRSDLSAIADFSGAICRQLGWEKPKNQLRVIIFDQQGRRHREWDDLKDYAELTQATRKLFP
jgi:hypothetical protein